MGLTNNSSLYSIGQLTIERPEAGRAPFTERGALRLFVHRSSSVASLWESLRVLAKNSDPRPYPSSNYFFLRRSALARPRYSGRSLGASFLFHALLLGLLVYLPILLPADDSVLLSAPLREAPIYYRVPIPEEVTPLPRIIPAGGGGKPGSGSRPALAPSKGSSAPHPTITIVSKPVHPDNVHQTIYQASSPPDLKITQDLKLPNIVLGSASAGPKALFSQNNSKPVQTSRQLSDVTAPELRPLTTTLQPSVNQPRLAIPVATGGAPLQRSANASGGLSAASLEGQDLMILGVDPDSSKQFSLPEGTRWGEFSIAPPTGSPGSPGGETRGAVGGGTGDGLLGGNGSTGVGISHAGGGGGNSGTAGPVSISGPGTGEGTRASLALTANNLVYPIPAPVINARRNSLVVSAGPIGGGGINAYGALNCGNIYSVFLPMPGRNWSLQYCETSTVGQKAPMSQSAVVHLQNPLLPPDVDLAQRFDFKRLPVPTDKSYRMILLKGTIGLDGNITNLTVYQGVLAEMDEAARVAFSRWHFRPAMRDGKPVAVEVLVGIPPASGEDRVNR